jgi:hypothetical protein
MRSWGHASGWRCKMDSGIRFDSCKMAIRFDSAGSFILADPINFRSTSESTSICCLLHCFQLLAFVGIQILFSSSCNLTTRGASFGGSLPKSIDRGRWTLALYLNLFYTKLAPNLPSLKQLYTQRAKCSSIHHNCFSF